MKLNFKTREWHITVDTLVYHVFSKYVIIQVMVWGQVHSCWAEEHFQLVLGPPAGWGLLNWPVPQSGKRKKIYQNLKIYKTTKPKTYPIDVLQSHFKCPCQYCHAWSSSLKIHPGKMWKEGFPFAKVPNCRSNLLCLNGK